ncbi:hypothetical protein PR003_g17335 [Phytophthora rubi]|uniref:Uncharacterized protein n=1 Tax=Phytophthora rubi TaxID=129364 RepID=A0A6A3L4A2_9STRA|nr:hypothetical protein PR001_g15560 [Phytophthora rubi]KAE9322021.1 hypothetical protein PR003_g17335 [Phytophthora rubi]
MSTFKAGTDNDNGRGVNDAPLHAPAQLLDAPPGEGGASGSGGAGGDTDTPPGQADDAPQPDSVAPDEAPPRKGTPVQGDTLPGSEAGLGAPTTGVDLSTINDPAWRPSRRWVSCWSPSRSSLRPQRSTFSKVN